MASLPRIIDIRDDLKRAQETSENDIDNDVSEVLSKLERYSDPDRPHQMGLLDDVENTLLRLQEQETSERASQRFQAARNRIETFRNAVSNTGTDLVVVGTEFGSDDPDSGPRLENLDRVDVRVSVVNLGEPVECLVEVSFYDEDETLLHDATTQIALDSDEEKTTTLTAEVPRGTAYYATVAREVDA